jgi:predicted HAD superfamily Cof-like phosphohydrolase
MPGRGAPDESFFDDVWRFHVRTRLVVRDRPGVLPPEDWQRRVRLILEEFAELARAQAKGDVVEFADGLADLAWVVLGTAVEAGIPLNEVWAEVRRSNMAKVGGRLDESGKLLKPAGWSPPDVAGVLARAEARSA